MESFLFCIRLNDRKRRGTAQEQNGQIQDPSHSMSALTLLNDLWRIIASEWLVFDTYAERSLNNIEKWFEIHGEDLPQFDLHRLLSQLMKIQRRMTKYSALISEQIEGCPDHWRKHEHLYHVSPMQDFERVLKHFEHKQTRSEHAIQVAASLMGTHQTKLAESRNAILFALNIVTSVLLPFSTVAAIMAIPTDSGLGPNRAGFWIFWASTCGLLVLLTGFYVFWKRVIKPGRFMLHRERKVSNLERNQRGARQNSYRANKVLNGDVEYGNVIKSANKRSGNTFLSYS